MASSGHRKRSINSSRRRTTSAIYFTLTGFHMAHLVAGILMLSIVLAWLRFGVIARDDSKRVSIAAIYWHFVDAVWIVVFFTIYVTPYLGVR